MSKLFIQRFNRIIIIIITIIIIISLATSALVHTSITLPVSLTILKVETLSKQYHKPAPTGQDDAHYHNDCCR